MEDTASGHGRVLGRVPQICMMTLQTECSLKSHELPHERVPGRVRDTGQGHGRVLSRVKTPVG